MRVYLRVRRANGGWELREVEHRDTLTHSLELFPEFARPLPPQKHAAPTVSATTTTDYIVDISRQLTLQVNSEAFVRMVLLGALGQFLDNQVQQGTGASGELLGLFV